MARPIDTITPTMNATTSWPRKNPPMARLRRWATRSTSSFDRAGIERLDHPAEVGQVDEQVEGDDRREEEDERDVEDPEAELAHPVELLLEGRGPRGSPPKDVAEVVPRGDLDRPVRPRDRSCEVVDVLLEVGADLGPLVAQLVGLVAGRAGRRGTPPSTTTPTTPR